MSSDLLIGLAISVIVIGFLILAGVALWLAAERHHTLSAAPGRPARQRGSHPAGQQQPPAAPPSTAAAEGKTSSAPSAGTQAEQEAFHSGEYPSAALYDQTLLPEASKRRAPPQSK